MCIRDSGYDENIALAKAKDKILFLSSTFLYRKENQSIIEKVHEAQCPLNYIYHVGQYLPDWHPWESYNNYFKMCIRDRLIFSGVEGSAYKSYKGG